ncbi:TetR family transcriptional regulator [Mycobacteroides immunogenum]|uniref:TetR family transcriptional regulator n=1 Tax=Mycobacteroides immunogenum TaxID=83262 RepID=A0A179VAD4_9MYCO|nr:TetR/AcrR family transcriptional regulator [Mycobacteroides immunogenum]OAT67941.1 TetR family transcriptional regulator [Mycobacteroides immunogenum]
MPTRSEILDHAIAVVQAGEPLTIDAVARASGLTKPGVVHHFKTKEALTEALMDRIAERWETSMAARTPDGSDPVQRLRAYVEYALTDSFDQSDLVMFADVRLREQLRERWVERMDPWFGMSIKGPVQYRARLRAARILADGAWFNKALGVSTSRADEQNAIRAIALNLLGDSGIKGEAE